MLRHTLLHPTITGVLGQAGHHARVLIADGNYPASTKRGPGAVLVSLNLSPGIVTCNQVLAAILSAVPVEAVQTMQYETGGAYGLTQDPPVWETYRATLRDNGLSLPLEPIEKWAFYDAVATADHVLTVQTADQQLWANLLLTIGCRTD